MSDQSRGIEDERQLEVTREKLRWLEQYYERTREKENLSPAARDDILLTTRRLINQLKEEIIRYEAHMVTPAGPE